MERTEFTTLYTAHFASTVRFLQRKTWLSDADAEDLAQSAWTKAWQHRDQFLGVQAKFKTWVYRIAFNELLSVRRRRNLVEFRAELPEQSVHFDADNCILVRELFHHADAHESRILSMRYLTDAGIQETAEAFDCPPNTVKCWTKRALSHLHDVANYPPIRPIPENVRLG